MINDNRSFNKILEQYAFEVASAFIESVDKTTQSELIELIAGIDTASDSAEVPVKLLPGEEMESEWQQVLSEPVDWASVHRHWHIGLVRQRMECQDRYRSHLEGVIQQTKQRYQEVRVAVMQEPYRSGLLNRYKSTLACYQKQLVIAQRYHQVNIKQLAQLEQANVDGLAF